MPSPDLFDGSDSIGGRAAVDADQLEFRSTEVVLGACPCYLALAGQHADRDSAGSASACVAVGADRRALTAKLDLERIPSSLESRLWTAERFVGPLGGVGVRAQVPTSLPVPPWRYPLLRRHSAVVANPHRSGGYRQRLGS